MLLIRCLCSVRLEICYLKTDFANNPRLPLPPFLPLVKTNDVTRGHLTGAGEDIVLLGYLMVNDLFNAQVAETTVVLRKPL